MLQWRQDSADTLPRLEELSRRERMGTEQIEDEPIKLWPDRLHHVQPERVACLQVGMEYAQSRTKSDR
jgi:hypothetical protein